MASRASVLVFGPHKIELGPPHEPRLGALEPEEARVLPHRGARDEIKFLPEPVELALAFGVEDELVERRVVAEVSRHAVEAGAQQPARVLLLLLRIEVDAGPLRDEERVGKGRAEASEGRLVPLAASAAPVGTASARAAGVPVGQLVGAKPRHAAGDVAPAVGHILAILPEHERLRAVVHAAGGQVLDLRRELLAELDHEIPHPLAAGPRRLRSVVAGRRQLAPQRLHRGDRAHLVGRFRQERPDRRQVLAR